MMQKELPDYSQGLNTANLTNYKNLMLDLILTNQPIKHLRMNTPKPQHSDPTRTLDRRQHMRRKIDMIDWVLDRLIRLVVPILLIVWALWVEW